MSAPISIIARAVSGYHWSQHTPTPSVERSGPLPHLEAGVARPEIEFLLIARAVGNVALAIDAGDLAVGADHRQAVVMVRPVGLEEAGRDPDLQLLGQRLHRQHRGMLGGRHRCREQALVLDPAEIGAFEQLGREHDLGALARRFADQLGHGADVGAGIFGERELQRGDGDGHGRASTRGAPLRATRSSHRPSRTRASGWVAG